MSSILYDLEGGTLSKVLSSSGVSSKGHKSSFSLALIPWGFDPLGH